MQRKRTILWGLLATVVIAGTGFAGGYAVGAGNPTGVPVQDVANATVPPDVNAGDFGLFWKTWRLIDAASYKAADDSSQERIYGAIKGLVGSLGDPYSVFFTPEENQRFSESVQGAFGGVGIEIDIKDSTLVVVAPLKDTPADRAGLVAGDYIVEIDEESTAGVSVEQAINLIRGNEGTKVTLTIVSKDGKDRKVELVRERIEIPSLEVKMEGTVAHISLYEFTADAGAKFGEAVRGLPKNTTAVVLDLRNNPGGRRRHRRLVRPARVDHRQGGRARRHGDHLHRQGPEHARVRPGRRPGQRGIGIGVRDPRGSAQGPPQGAACRRDDLRQGHGPGGQGPARRQRRVREAHGRRVAHAQRRAHQQGRPRA